MRTILQFDRLFVYSEKKNSFFNAAFRSGVNIIYGRNTSGKSTVLQSILYTVGINDGKSQLQSILDEEPFFRLDCTLSKGEVEERLIIIRDDETLIIKRADLPSIRFSGINGNNSKEHIKLKEYMHELFEFGLQLESIGEYKPAPIETMFLPYYVSQAVGWVYLRKSFGGLDFYKNFKEDYLDYYLGIENYSDRMARQQLEKRQADVLKAINFYTAFSNKNVDWEVSRLTDENFSEESIKYIDSYKEMQKAVATKEREYVLLCNELSYFLERKSVLTKVNKHHQAQKPMDDNCPTCAQPLPISLPATYKYIQEKNDTTSELVKYKEKIKAIQAKINSFHDDITERKKAIADKYQVLTQYTNENISFDRWLKGKANMQLIESVKIKLGELMTEADSIKEGLKAYKTNQDVQNERHKKNVEFEEIFKSYLRKLGVKELEEDRYVTLYKISAFPSQGVELHKTVAAYHFALNNLVQKTDGIHRFPFMLDAIFKEDFDNGNRKVLLEFIAGNRPKDTQLFIAIAERKEEGSFIAEYNSDYFFGEANLICIGDSERERAFLSPYNNEEQEYLEETLAIMNG